MEFQYVLLIAGLVWVFVNANMFSIICNEQKWLIGWNPIAIFVISLFMWWYVLIWCIQRFSVLTTDFKFKFYALITTLVLGIIGALTYT